MALAALLGLALAAVLVVHAGLPGVAAALLAVGWSGMIAFSLLHLIALGLSASAWRGVTAAGWHGGAALFLGGRWIREAVSNLLPVVQIGGELVAARLLCSRGAPAAVAGASVAVDLTLEVISQLAFTLTGAGALLATRGAGAGAMPLLGGIALAAAALAGFVLAQRGGLFLRLERALAWLTARLGWSGAGALTGLHRSVMALYRERAAVARAVLLHFGAWLAGALEVWLALRLMGHPLPLSEAFILESLGQAARSAAFAVPSGLGAQEAGLLLAGAALGVDPQAALALSLLKRLREIVLGLPALAAWQVLETRRLRLEVPGT